MGLSIDIAVEHDGWHALGDVQPIVERAAKAALARSKESVEDGTELSVVLGDDAFVQTLNRNWRGKDKPTNVLSFPVDPSARSITLGDVAIAFQTVMHEAAEEHKRPADHLAHLVVHGVLHLLGFDHETDGEAEAMERIEIEALADLGIASPYEDAVALRAAR